MAKCYVHINLQLFEVVFSILRNNFQLKGYPVLEDYTC